MTLKWNKEHPRNVKVCLMHLNTNEMKWSVIFFLLFFFWFSFPLFVWLIFIGFFFAVCFVFSLFLLILKMVHFRASGLCFFLNNIKLSLLCNFSVWLQNTPLCLWEHRMSLLLYYPPNASLTWLTCLYVSLVIKSLSLIALGYCKRSHANTYTQEFAAFKMHSCYMSKCWVLSIFVVKKLQWNL